MGRLNVYLPDEIEAQMRDLGLKPSELLQGAIQEAAEDAERDQALETYLDELELEVGPASDADRDAVDRLLEGAHQHAAARRARAS